VSEAAGRGGANRQLVVRVLPDEPAIAKTFDYFVPPELRDEVRVGTIVRIDLHGRRLRGWVVVTDAEPPADVALKPIAKVTGWGPPPEVVELAEWAAWRWAGHPSALLGTASPPGAIRGLPPPARTSQRASDADALAQEALAQARAVVRLPPAADPFPFVAAAVERGHALVVCPSVGSARHMADGLRAEGEVVAVMPDEWARAAAGATVVGARAAAWAPVRDLAAVVVLDEHDEVHQEERTPTWHARDVAVERAARAGVPCVLLSPCPTLEAQDWAGEPLTLSTADERAGWPLVDVIDRRKEDPLRAGLYSEALVGLLRDRGRGRAVCVLNRKGRSRLLACLACGELVRCERCHAALGMPEAGRLRCGRCGAERPQVCAACGASAMRNLRVGVSRVREELEALLGEPVTEVAGSRARQAPGDHEPARVLVGTEAVLHQVRAPVGVVAFLDFDQELMAPRYRAGEQALALLVRAGRLLGGRRTGGRLAIQTRLPRHPVVQAALQADPGRVADDERTRRRQLRYPPFAALAAVSGPAAEQFVANLGLPLGIELLGPADGRWLLRADDHRTLCDALAATVRPPGRVRVEVDPLRV
jgi:primosomal protein N' (replication factor Y)